MPRDPVKGLTALLAAVTVPLAVCALLLPVRGTLSPTNVAQILMLVVAAVAALGYRWAAVLTALSAAVWFVFFFTTPYESFTRINKTDDVITAGLLLVVGLAVSQLARRYTRERAIATTLQRSLLPRVLPDTSAVRVACRYVPAEAEVGGDWFDVIPLPGFRTALVVGDVVGHGLRSAVTMGRLRTAVRNFSTLDLPPDELLARLDDVVNQMDAEAGASEDGTIAATCLYAIYDPVSCSCAMARAGHFPPAIVHPDGRVEILDLAEGPPLGLGGLRFEAAERQLPEDTQLVLYTDGLIENRQRDIGVGLKLLCDALSGAGTDPEETCDTVLETVLPARPVDDVALLIACTRAFPRDRIAEWDIPAVPAAVSALRAEVFAKLAEWNLEETAFTTELILSELVTNAIRYGAPPVHLRLLRDSNLVVEVSDASSTSPHLRYATDMDEGGRGIFLVAQFAERWGTRFTPTGKIVWAEQSAPSVPVVPVPASVA
ncbi:SpoIIE family protein phosphatase [Streptomyces sp. NBC_00873]|uniref:ATP-binding SpoIIE family protein phosphatase n=1 Tax=unclassified Streptomyces TaxID=2593676 RepID=UPI0038660B80|nr:SpoIIE family protein phosphatase [Streptomyces sp. NBC_00873]WTA43438.1 SpoIIE family protein phosphatase [Streptomyces sp. NBC_00842]